MRNRISLLSGLALVAVSVALTGCDPGKDKPAETTPATTTPGTTSPVTTATGGGKYKVITNGISPFWDSLGKGIDDVNPMLKSKADWQGPPKSEHTGQISLFKDALTQKVDGIAVSVIEPDAFAPTIDAAVDAGTPVITFDSDCPKSKRAAYIGTNNFEAGKTCGEEIVKLYPKGGKLIAFVGNMSAQNARDRYAGIKEALKGHNIDFLCEPFEDNKDNAKARKNAEDAITRYQSQGLSGLVGLYSYNGPAIVGAVEAAKLHNKIKIACFDGDPKTLENLEKGLVDVTVVQKPFQFGRLSVMLLDYLRKDNKDINKALADMKPELDKLSMKVDMDKHIIDTGVTVITPKTAVEFNKNLKAMGLSST